VNEEMIEQEVQQPEVQEEVIQEEVVEPEIQEQPQQEQRDFAHNAFEENVKNLREAKTREEERASRAEYERDQLARYVENIQQQVNGGQAQQPQDALQDDDYIEGKQFKQVTKQMQDMKQELQQWKNYSEETTAELKLNNEFSDFNNVVTGENVKAFLKEYPEMRGSVQNNDPLYNRGKATYRLIKKFMGEDMVKPVVNKKNQVKVQKNMNTPRPTSAINKQQESPLSHANLLANGYNEEVGQSLEDEMYSAIERY